MTDHPIVPPPELVQQWLSEFYGSPMVPAESNLHIANLAAQWGADQELEACLEWTTANFGELPGQNLHLYRRPKPPSLKEQALQELNNVDILWDTTEFDQETLNSLDTIRKALEALPDD